MLNKRGQIWIETVLYTLIGISLIALVLAFVSPKINEIKDRAVVEQTIASLNDLDTKIYSLVSLPAGNRKIYEIIMKRGELTISPGEDVIRFKLGDLTKPYSQVNAIIRFGRIELVSTQEKKYSSVQFMLNYSGMLDLTYGDDNVNGKKFTQATTPYRFFIENKDIVSGLRVISMSPA